MESISSNQKQTQKNVVTISSEYPEYSNQDGMEKSADLIIRGTIESSEERLIDIAAKPRNSLEDTGGNAGDTIYPYIVSKVNIIEVYKGKHKYKSGDQIELKQLGGEKDNLTYIEEDTVKMDPGEEEYIFFLKTYNDVPASLLSMSQGVFTVKGDKAINKVSKSPTTEISIKKLKSLK
jgi:hypothetical protein